MSAPNENGTAAAKGARNTRAAAALKAFHEEERFGKAYDLRLVKKSWPFIRPHQKLLWLSLGVVFFTAGSALVRPLIMRHALDEGVVAGHADQLMRGGILLASVMVVEQVLGFMQMYAMQVAGARAMADLRRHVFDFLHRQRLGFFDRQLVGKLVPRVTNDVDSMLELFASGALLSVGDLIKLIGIILVMVALDPPELPALELQDQGLERPVDQLPQVAVGNRVREQRLRAEELGVDLGRQCHSKELVRRGWRLRWWDRHGRRRRSGSNIR